MFLLNIFLSKSTLFYSENSIDEDEATSKEHSVRRSLFGDGEQCIDIKSKFNLSPVLISYLQLFWLLLQYLIISNSQSA